MTPLCFLMFPWKLNVSSLFTHKQLHVLFKIHDFTQKRETRRWTQSFQHPDPKNRPVCKIQISNLTLDNRIVNI